MTFTSYTLAKTKNPCSGEIFALGCKIFELVKKNAAERKADVSNRLDMLHKRHNNDTKHVIHLIAQNVESLSEEQVAEINMVTKQTEDKLRRLKHLLNQKLNETNISIFNKSKIIFKMFKSDIAELRNSINKQPEVRNQTPDNKLLKSMEDSIKQSINKSRDNYEMKFLLTAKYVGEKYVNLESRVNDTVKDVRKIMRRIENDTENYRNNYNELQHELEHFINNSGPASRMEVARMEEKLGEKYHLLTREINESISRVENGLTKAIGKRLISRDGINKVDNIEKAIERILFNKFATFEGEIEKNITKASNNLKNIFTSQMDSNYNMLRKKLYKNLSVITGSVMRDIVLITQNVRDMWKFAKSKGWPDGHYCLYKYGECPDGFVLRRSHVHKKSIYCCR